MSAAFLGGTVRADGIAVLLNLYAAGQDKTPAALVQRKAQRQVIFDISAGTRKVIATWLDTPLMVGSEHLWPGRFHDRKHVSTRQTALPVRDWATLIGLESRAYDTHSMRWTKVAQMYRKIGDLGAVQRLLCHAKMEINP